MRKKVLMVTSTFPRWQNDGVPDFVYELSRRMSLFHDVFVVAPWYPKAKSYEDMNGLHVYRYRYFLRFANLAYGGGMAVNLKRNPFYMLVVPFFLVFQLVCVWRILKKEAPDVVHVHWIIPNALVVVLACYLARLDPRKRVICSCHGTDIVGFRGRWGRALKRWVSERINCLTVVSDELRVLLSSDGVAAKHCYVVSMGTDFDHVFYRRSEIWRDPYASLFVGRLIEQKGLMVLLESFLKIVIEYPQARLHIVGDGPMRKSVESFIDKRGLSGKVEVHGFCSRESVATYFNRCRFSIFPSLVMEGFGLSMVEGMGCECVTLASDFPSARGIVRHEVNGFLFEPGSVAELTRLWLREMSAQSDGAEIGRRARADVVERFGWGGVTQSFQNIYDGIE